MANQATCGMKNLSTNMKCTPEMCKSGLLLVSSNFLASDFIMEHELPYLLRAREDGQARIIIAVISDCFWDETPLKEIQAAHDPSKPLKGLSDSECDKTIKSICRKLMQD